MTRTEVLLGLSVLGVTVLVNLITTSAEQGGWEHGKNGFDQAGCELDCVGVGEAELTRRRFCSQTMNNFVSLDNSSQEACGHCFHNPRTKI